MLTELTSAERLDAYQALIVRHHPQLPSVWTLEFEHGKANEVGVAVLDELAQLTEALCAPEGPVALISFSRRVSAKGTPIFISGANVTERGGWSDQEVKAHVRRQRSILSALRRAPVFHVCVVHGVALGWGTEFLITADYKLATPSARFGLPETGLGILPGAGGTSELSSLISPAHALRLGMTGERISCDEALRIGLVQERHEELSEALARATALCALTARNSPTALAAFKEGLLNSIGVEPSERMEREALAYERCVAAGQAAIGRRDFTLIRAGERPDWGPRRDTQI